jgi:predicted RNA-binding protein with PIN domain
MGFLVDGSNLGGALAGGRGAREPAGIVELLLGWARGRRQVIVVFDGPPAATLARRYGGLEVRFAAPRTADEVILGMLGERAASWHVVSDDRELLAACRAKGARTMQARELAAELRAAERRTTGKSAKTKPAPHDAPVDVADWEAWFRRGGDADD